VGRPRRLARVLLDRAGRRRLIGLLLRLDEGHVHDLRIRVVLLPRGRLVQILRLEDRGIGRVADIQRGDVRAGVVAHETVRLELDVGRIAADEGPIQHGSVVEVDDVGARP